MRQPQDFVRGVADKQVPPWIQPEPEDTFLDVCTPFSSSAIPGYANPGCMIPSKLSPSYTTPTGYVSSGYILEGYV
jgi:hypothetical protein